MCSLLYNIDNIEQAPPPLPCSWPADSLHYVICSQEQLQKRLNINTKMEEKSFICRKGFSIMLSWAFQMYILQAPYSIALLCIISCAACETIVFLYILTVFILI